VCLQITSIFISSDSEYFIQFRYSLHCLVYETLSYYVIRSFLQGCDNNEFCHEPYVLYVIETTDAGTN